MKNLCSKKSLNLLFLFLLFFASNVYASSTGNLPFNTAMDTFKSNFIEAIFDIAVILMMATCMMLAFGEWSDGVKRFIGIVFFLSLALAAPTGITLLFGNGAVF
jgi:type IV secretory pathway VirB2 component (pilin)